VQQSEPAKSEFSIISENGQTVYYKETKKQDSQFKAVFDLSALEDGEYTVRYKTGAALVKRNVAISSGEIEIKSMKTQFDPVFALYGNVLKVSYLNYEQEKLKLLIYDDGELIYNSSLGNEFTFQRGFDLSNLDEGNYDISLASNDEEYWFSVTK
ncbi:MAG: hypothetical protein HQ541_00125, partial [Mariniphaga sp.]|nr:hypothetical protein [Mariniphaga sp.]